MARSASRIRVVWAFNSSSDAQLNHYIKNRTMRSSANCVFPAPAGPATSSTPSESLPALSTRNAEMGGGDAFMLAAGMLLRLIAFTVSVLYHSHTLFL